MRVLGVLDRRGDLAGLRVGERARHVLDVLLERRGLVGAEQRRERLRHALRGNDGAGNLG